MGDPNKSVYGLPASCFDTLSLTPAKYCSAGAKKMSPVKGRIAAAAGLSGQDRFEYVQVLAGRFRPGKEGRPGQALFPQLAPQGLVY